MKLPNYYMDNHTLHVGCEEPRAYFIPAQSYEAARDENRAKSAYFKSLCGMWDFRYFNSVRDLPEIAELTGDNLNTVKSKYYRALRKMADMKGLL